MKSVFTKFTVFVFARHAFRRNTSATDLKFGTDTRLYTF
jgi:hypothetical protein